MKPLAQAPLTPPNLAKFGRDRSGGLELTDAQARVLGSLHAHAFDAPRSCPSQALIGREVNLTREYVNRLCRELADLGLIAWTQTRRRGSRWAHNVYELRHWKPAGTARVLALLERIRGRRPRRVHTETATTAPRTAVALFKGYEPLFEEVDVDSRGSPTVVLVR